MPKERKEIYLIQPYSLKELSGMYNVSKNTFKKWIEPIAPQLGERIGYYYTIHQVKIIFRYLGVPRNKTKKQ
jgi:hypothetical protein